MLIKMNNQDQDFYKYFGKVFGSRSIQKITTDRFYDDDNKTWYASIEAEIVAVISVADNKIKNVYATDKDELVKVLKNVLKDIKGESVVPVIYQECYCTAGYKIARKKGNNYIIIKSV